NHRMATNDHLVSGHSSTSSAAGAAATRHNVWTQTDDRLLFDLVHEFMASEHAAIRNVLAQSGHHKSAQSAPKSQPLRQTKSSERSTMGRPSNSKSSLYN